jgi:hypothetical protein
MTRLPKPVEKIFVGFLLFLAAIWIVINLPTITHWLMPDLPYQEIETHLAIERAL